MIELPWLVLISLTGLVGIYSMYRIYSDKSIELQCTKDNRDVWYKVAMERFDLVIDQSHKIARLNVEWANAREEVARLARDLQQSRNYAMKLRKTLAKYQTFRLEIEDSLDELEETDDE